MVMPRACEPLLVHGSDGSRSECDRLRDCCEKKWRKFESGCRRKRKAMNNDRKKGMRQWPCVLAAAEGRRRSLGVCSPCCRLLRSNLVSVCYSSASFHSNRPFPAPRRRRLRHFPFLFATFARRAHGEAGRRGTSLQRGGGGEGSTHSAGSTGSTDPQTDARTARRDGGQGISSHPPLAIPQPADGRE